MCVPYRLRCSRVPGVSLTHVASSRRTLVAGKLQRSRSQPRATGMKSGLKDETRAGPHVTIALQDAEIRCLKLERDTAQVRCFSH